MKNRYATVSEADLDELISEIQTEISNMTPKERAADKREAKNWTVKVKRSGKSSSVTVSKKK